jgi:hypothetical protein
MKSEICGGGGIRAVATEHPQTMVYEIQRINKRFVTKVKGEKMANRKLCGVIAVLLVFGAILTSCASMGKENIGSFPEISVPAKDFTSLGIVQTENIVDNNRGEVFTYHELIKLAKELGADAIVNVTIDVKREGTKFLFFYFNPKETWYGSATAIKWTSGTLKGVTTNNTNGTIVTSESVIMSGSGGGGFGSSSSTKKWYNPLTW